jgi:hypothetical protein
MAQRLSEDADRRGAEAVRSAGVPLLIHLSFAPQRGVPARRKPVLPADDGYD